MVRVTADGQVQPRHTGTERQPLLHFHYSAHTACPAVRCLPDFSAGTSPSRDASLIDRCPRQEKAADTTTDGTTEIRSCTDSMIGKIDEFCEEVPHPQAARRQYNSSQRHS